jgi:hypothetical protein
MHAFCWAFLEKASPFVHSAFSPFFNKIAVLPKDIWSITTPEKMSLRGAVFGHTIVHALLFGTYASSKEIFLGDNVKAADEIVRRESKEKDNTSINTLLGITAAGFFAGAVAEVVGYYVKPLEVVNSATMTSKKGIKTSQPFMTRIKACVRQAPPNVKPILFAALSSGIGFVALEFA